MSVEQIWAEKFLFRDVAEFRARKVSLTRRINATCFVYKGADIAHHDGMRLVLAVRVMPSDNIPACIRQVNAILREYYIDYRFRGTQDGKLFLAIKRRRRASLVHEVRPGDWIHFSLITKGLSL